MNNCGCNNIRGPLLTEKKVKSLLSENLQYHLDKDIPLFESVFRIGSNAHLKLIKEARKMYSRDIIDLCEEDEHLIKTHLGEFGSYKGESVPLDLPMLNEINIGAIAGGVAASRKKKRSKKELAQMIDMAREMGVDVSKYEKYLNEKLSIAGKEVEKIDKIGNDPENWVVKYKDGSEEPYLKHLVKEAYSGFIRNPEDPDSEPFNPTGAVSQFREDLRALFGKFKGDLKNPEFIKGVAEIMVNWKSLLRSQLNNSLNEGIGNKINIARAKSHFKQGEKIAAINKKTKKVTKITGANQFDSLNPKEYDFAYLVEAEFKGKEVALNKPKRGGPKAYYVYVKDGDKVKKVTFGSGGLRAKIKNKEARNAFAKRHNCDKKKDRTKAGYWSCNLPRYAKMLGLGANMNTYW